MNLRVSAGKYYRSILIASLLSGASLLGSRSVLADENNPTLGTIVENQVTAQFTNAADSKDRKISSDRVTVKIAEVSENAASNIGVLTCANDSPYDD
jgi:hypothetical protein